MTPVTIEPFIGKEHTTRMTVLQRFWIAVLLMQLGLFGLTMAAVPKYATGESPLSVGLALASTLLVAFAFWLTEQWERAQLGRIPVSILDARSESVSPDHDYVFAEPNEALLRAVNAVIPTVLVKLALVLSISFAAWLLRQQGTSLAFSVMLLGISLFIQWRIFPGIEGIATKLERLKGVRFAPVTAPRLRPTMRLDETLGGVSASHRPG